MLCSACPASALSLQPGLVVAGWSLCHTGRSNQTDMYIGIGARVLARRTVGGTVAGYAAIGESRGVSGCGSALTSTPRRSAMARIAAEDTMVAAPFGAVSRCVLTVRLAVWQVSIAWSTKSTSLHRVWLPRAAARPLA